VASAPVDVGALRRGDLPAVCVKTGVPTEFLVRTGFTVVPGWTWWLLLCGVVPFVLAQVFAGEKVEATLPVSDEALRRVRAWRWAWRICAALAVVLIVLAGVLGSAAVAWAGAALIVASLVVSVGANLVWVGVTNTRRRDQVFLTRVHPRFAYELGRRSVRV